MARFSTTGGSGSGSALNYVQVAGEQVTISSAPNAFIDLDITTTGKPVQISVTGEGNNASAESWVRINLFRDNVAIGNEMQLEASAVSENVPFAINFIDDVAAGTYNYSARVTEKSSGNWQFGESDGPIMNAVELTGFKGDRGLQGIQGIQGEPGSSGEGGDIADFVFDTVEDETTESRITVANHDMIIRTTRTDDQDADISLNSADDIWLNAGDEIEIDANSTILLRANDGIFLNDPFDSDNQIATIGDIQSANTADFVFSTVEEPDYESTMTVTNNDMVIKTVVDTEASGNIRVESAQGVTVDANGDILIESKNGSDVVQARILLDQSNDQVLLEAVNEDNDWFNDTQWSTAVWSGTTVSITNTPDIITFFNNVPSNVTRVAINGGVALDYSGASYGAGNITIDVGGSPMAEQDPLTVTEIRLYYSRSSKIDINVDNGSFDIISGSMSMTIDSSGDLEINARDEDIDIRANDDIRFTTNWNINETEPQWRMTNSGRFELPGSGYISNPADSSGDGYNNDTLHIIPDDDLVDGDGSDQYLIIDPTSPNHIHIRSGGDIDESSAYLIIGGEKTNVTVSDGDRNVYVNSRSPFIINSYTNLSTENSTTFTVASTADIQNNYTVNVGGTDYIVDSVNSVDEGVIGVTANGAIFDANGSYTFTYEQSYSSQWIFHNNGTLSGPTEPGWLQVSGIYGESGSNTYIASQENLVLYTDENQGVYINDANDGLNEVATKRDIANVGEEFTVIEESFTVNGGTTATQPTFDGDPLFSGTYVKTGPMVHFQIQVDMDNITSFGTGQYYVDLPFDAKYGYQFKEGCLHDISTSNQFAIGGHVAAGTNRLFLTYTGSNGQDEMFTHSSPVGLNVADNFHISGTYIAD